MTRMRPRTPITAEQIITALERSSGDVGAAAALLKVSGRTLYRRMAEFGIKPHVRYQIGEAA